MLPLRMHHLAGCFLLLLLLLSLLLLLAAVGENAESLPPSPETRGGCTCSK
jgi:hypothetical protein